jgi:hypothetical protein
MRRVLFALTFALLALTAGCQSNPPSAPASAAGADNPGFLARLFGGKPKNEAKSDVGPNGMAMGQKTKLDKAIESIQRRGGLVQVEADFVQKLVVVADLHGFYNVTEALDSLAPLTKLRDINLHNTGFSDADLEYLRGLLLLQKVNLSSTKITDNGLAMLLTLPNLRTLNLNETRISDAGLQYLRAMPNLSDLSLFGTKVTDRGLAQLKDMKELRKLVIGGSREITDGCLTSLAAIPQLHELTILSSRVTDSGIEDLKLASHQLKIVH